MATLYAQQPTSIKYETIPVDTLTPEKSIIPTSGPENDSLSDINEEPTSSIENEETEKTVDESFGGFFGSLRKKIRSAAGIDSQFVNPYLGKDHSNSKIPPYGHEQISTSPAAFPTSSMVPLHQQYSFPVPWSNDFYQQQQQHEQAMLMMMNGMPPSPYGNRMPMMMNPGISSGYYGSVPPRHRDPAPFLYPSNSLLDYAYSAHDPYLAVRQPYHGAGYHPFCGNALSVQDKRLLPERELY